ncbi:MAG: PKD domain-containing protein, partial [Cytophagales bacterium]|nr:PKD domain-containing protein [Cytophagales bacterium]
YKGLFTLPATCDDWSISWFDCYRTNNITNIQNPGGTCISVEAKLNNKDFHASSAVFNNDILGFACNGSQNLINLGATAPNGDVLVYSSTTPLTLVPAGVPQTVTYKSGFSASNPFPTGNTFQVNSNTGDIKFTPTVTGDKAVISILVQQYRNGQLVGSVMKDQQIGVFDCVLPTITTSSISATYCAKSPINIQFGGKDPANNKVSLSWNNGIPAGSFAPIGASVGSYTQNQQASFTWTPSNNDIGKKSFIVTIKNDACPISFPQSISVNFEILPAPEVTLRSDTIVPCLVNFPLTYTYLANGTPPYTYLWNTGETTASVSKPTGSYTLVVSDRNGCKGSDDVNLTSGINADFRISTSTCVGTPLDFRDLSTSSASINSWRWDFGNGITSSSSAPTVTYPTEGFYDVSLTVGDNNNCTQTVKKRVAICSIPKLTFASLDSCVRRDVKFTYSASSNVCALKYLEGTFGDGASFVAGGANSGPFNVNSISANLSYSYDTTGVAPGNYGTYTVRPMITNLGNCATTTSLSVRIYPRPTYISNSPLSTAFNCDFPVVTLSGIATTTATGARPPLSYVWSTGATAVNTITVNGVGLYSLTVIDQLGCSNSLSYQVNNPISAGVSIVKGYCNLGDSVKFVSSANSSWGIKSRIWNMGDGTTQSGPKAGKVFFQGKDTTFVVRLIATDNSNCIDSSAYAIAKIALPKQKKIFPKDSCFGNNITLQSPENSKVLVIDSLCWNVRNPNYSDTLWFQTRSNVSPFSCKMNSSSDVANFSPILTFNRPGKNYIKAEVNYNNTCKTTYYDTVNVWNIVKDTVSYNNRCALFPTTFTPVKISG